MADELTGKVFADKYRVVSLLRSSDLGNFYRCRHVFTERPVILQILRPELIGNEYAEERFSRMAKQISQIAHPNILAVTDFGLSPEGSHYATLENIDGETLAEALVRDGQVPANVALSVAGSAASGLSAAHAAGIIHGKLSPANMLVVYGADGSKTVKLFDFGSATAISADESSVREFGYTAPELCSGAEKPDALSDIYSLGIVMYEMLAGDVPFTGDTPAAIINGHIEEPPPPLSSFRSDISPATESLVLQALSKNPEMRYQSAAEFAEAIDLHMIGLDASGAPVAAAAVSESNNLWKTGFVVLAGISLLSAFLIYATSSKQTNPATVLQPDANGVPVQPINPATGAEEQNLAAMPGAMYDVNSNVNGMAVPPGTIPGGDGYNPWGNGGMPPPGAPQSFPQGGQTVTVPNGQSPFTVDDGQCIMQPSGLLLCPVPATNTAVKPTPTPKKGAAANTNTQAPANANTAPKSSPTPAAAKTPAPTKSPAAAANKPD